MAEFKSTKDLREVLGLVIQRVRKDCTLDKDELELCNVQLRAVKHGAQVVNSIVEVAKLKGGIDQLDKFDDVEFGK